MAAPLSRRSLLKLSLALPFASATPFVQAQTNTALKMVLDWKLQGIHAWYFLAIDRGYYAREKIDLTVDQGDGSASAVTKVMTGAYDAAFGDINAIMQNAVTRPAQTPVMVYMIYNGTPFALVTKNSSGIKTLHDLQGRTLGSPAGGSALKMFPVLAKQNGLDQSKIKWSNMAPNLQEQMLLRDQVDASAVFSVTSYMNLVAQHVDPDRDMRWFNYGDFGIDPYGNGLLVSQNLIKQRPEVVAGLVRATHQGMHDAVADPDAAIAALMKREPLLDPQIEKRRLLYALRTLILTPEAARIGVGDVDPVRLKRSIGQVQTAFDLPSQPSAAQIFDGRFLPALAARKLA